MTKKYSIMLNGLLDGISLSEKEAYELMISMATEDLSPSLSGALLAGLRAKGETANEVRALVDSMYEHAQLINIADRAVDIVGTGGDGAQTINI